MQFEAGGRVIGHTQMTWVMLESIPFRKIRDDAIAPTKAFVGDAGWDLYAAGDFVIPPWKCAKIPTGIAVAIHQGFAGQVAERSGLGSRGIAVRGGVIDSGYRGEIVVVLQNLNDDAFEIGTGDRIAQLVIYPVCLHSITEVDELPKTARGERGFGSTGRLSGWRNCRAPAKSARGNPGQISR